MKTAIEQTWEVNGRVLTQPCPCGCGAQSVLAAFQVPSRHEGRPIMLASAAPEMARLLLRFESVGDGYCPACGVSRPDEEHNEHCEWVAVMKKAGVR